MKRKILIAGAGGIGEAAALLLREWSEIDIDLYLGDVSAARLAEAKAFVLKNSAKETSVETLLMPAGELSEETRRVFEDCDCLLDCSPGGEAPRMARYARDFRMHYANLTEYVAETDAIVELARGAETGFVLQTGLAPGFINVLAMKLYRQFVALYENERPSF